MQAEQLLNLIRAPHSITTKEVGALRQLLYQYPYFQLAYTLVAKASHDQAPSKAQPAIQLAAVYATDRNQLKLLLENKLPLAAAKKAPPQVAATANTVPPHQVQLGEEAEAPDFINSYINTIRNKAAQKVSNRTSIEQLDIIENFIRQGKRLSRATIQEVAPEATQVDLTQASTTLHDDLITESLAQIMLKQGKCQRALDIYSKLQLKFPEKKSYFSALSAAIKKEI